MPENGQYRIIHLLETRVINLVVRRTVLFFDPVFKVDDVIVCNKLMCRYDPEKSKIKAR